MKNLLKFLLFSIVFSSCQSDYLEEEIPVTPKRLVIVYMVADNNLDYFAIQDINEMEQGFPKNSEDKLVVYIDRNQNSLPSHPYLLEITHDETDAIVSPILRAYTEQNSSDATVFKNVLSEVSNYYPNEHFTSKGLVMWSHGNAWLPNGISIATNRDVLLENVSKSFGLDDASEKANMDIKELATVLENDTFDFILFDACFMASIEVIYELRNTADYFISSATEILSSGFPYTEVTPLFFEENIDVNSIASTYFNHYNNKTGLQKSASISVVKMNKIENLTTQIFNFSSALASNNNLVIPAKQNVQQLDRFNGEWIYDLQDFLSKTAKLNNLQNEYAEIVTQWNKTITYENKTPFMVQSIDLNSCNGISTYIPNTANGAEINEYYKTLQWFENSGYDKIFTVF